MPGAGRGTDARHFGIRVELEPENPLGLPHLLGADWSSYRWYASRAARDRALDVMRSGSPYFRPGDRPAVRYTAVDQ